jgi:hypothetical protein
MELLPLQQPSPHPPAQGRVAEIVENKECLIEAVVWPAAKEAKNWPI